MTIKEFTNKTQKISGIYCWFSKTSKKCYLGSAINIGKRTTNEYRELKNSKFINPAMQKDWNLFGENDFCLILMRKCEESQLLKMETKFITINPNLYNSHIPISVIDLSEEQKEMFWKHIKINGDNECWEWQGYLSPGGYGSGLFRKNRKRMPYVAHRIAYFLTNLDTDIHCIICHKCDNRKCCNPNHLFPGSSSQNSYDMISKNRGSTQILDLDDVKFLRDIYVKDTHVNPEELNNLLIDKNGKSVSTATIISLCKNKSWKDESYNPPPRDLCDIKEEIITNFFNEPTISIAKIMEYIKEKYQIITTKESVGKLLKGRQSKFTRNKIKDERTIKIILELKSQGFTHNEVVSYLSTQGITTSYNSICRIIKSQKEISNGVN